jgi:hypothetical protein
VVTDGDTLVAIATRSCNPAVALRQSTLRILSEDLKSPDEFYEHLDALVALIKDN